MIGNWRARVPPAHYAAAVSTLSFVLPRGGNWFFIELVAAIRDELERLAVPSSVHFGPFPEADDRVFVLVPPHEYVALEGEDAVPSPQTLARTMCICAEQPGTFWFDDDLAVARLAGATFDINPLTIHALKRAGIAARHLQLGHTPSWDRFDPSRKRDIDVLFLGNGSPRRLRALASYGPVLSRWSTHLQISDNLRPNTGDSATFLAEQKWDLLARSKVMINLHAGERPYFEWLRAIQALSCGAVLVSEHSASFAPLEPGEHFFVGRPESLGLIADELLRDEERCDRVRRQAYELIRDEMPFSRSVSELAEVARGLAENPPPDRPALWRPEDPPPPANFGQPAAEAGSEVVKKGLATIRGAVKDIRLDMIELRRELARLEQRIDSPNGAPVPKVVRVEETTAWRAHPTPKVSVVTALYNHRDLIEATLDSLARSWLRDREVIVVDDGSTDRSGEVARDWMRRNDDVPALLVRHPVNRGLGAARNTALDFARGPYCFILDSDNEIYPRCLDGLIWALEDDPTATFAYSLIEVFGDLDAYLAVGGGPLLNIFGWEADRLRAGNYIDAMALIRTAELREMGGYATDRRLYGFEDWDLWCRVADRGGKGRLVPQILARYRGSATSMQSISRLSATGTFAALIERSPSFMAGGKPPGWA